MLQVYIYFRGPAAQREAVTRALARLQAQLVDSAGVIGRVLIKREPQSHTVNAELTWMEIYENIDAQQLEPFLAALGAAHNRSGLAALPIGTRHTEVFENEELRA